MEQKDLLGQIGDALGVMDELFSALCRHKASRYAEDKNLNRATDKVQAAMDAIGRIRIDEVSW